MLRCVGSPVGIALGLVASVAYTVDVAAQDAQPAKPTELPALEVTAKTGQAKKKAVAPKKVAPSAPKPVQLADEPAEKSNGLDGAPTTGPVKGYVATSSAIGTKTDTPLLTTPQSVSVITNDEMMARGAESLTEILRYTPGITLGTYGSNSIYDNPIIRGFVAPTYIDGLRTPGNVANEIVPRINAYGVERLEVLRGSSSGLYGQTPPGGLINITSKRPTEISQNEVGVRLGSFDRRDLFFDVSGPVDQSRNVLYRFVGSGKLSDTQIDYVEDNNYYLAPSFTFRFSPDTSLTLLASSQRESGDGYQQYVPGVGSILPNPNGRIPYSRYLGEPSSDSHEVKYDSIGYAFEHRFNEVFQFRQNLKVSRLEGGVDAVSPFGPLGPDFRTVPRAHLTSDQLSKTFAVDNQAQADFVTGAISHKVLAGIDYYQTSSQNAFNFGPLATSIDVFSPTYGVPQSPLLLPFSDYNSDLKETGFYIQEQAKLDRWILTLTGRWDHATTTNDDHVALTSTSRTDDATTGRAALSYVFDSGFAPYISYATNFEPTAGLNRFGETFVPRTGDTKEVGIKYQPTFVKGIFTAAYFDTEQQNVLTTDPANTFFQVQSGNINVKGYEFEAKVAVSRNLDLIASYTHLDPRVTASNDGNVGNYAANIALENASLWAMYTFSDGPFGGLGLGGGVRYVGESYANASNTVVVPDYTVFDAALTYDFGFLARDLHGLSGRINVTNVADTYYATNCFGPNSCGLGTARTVLGTLSFKW